MPIFIQTPINIRITLQRVTLSWDDSQGSLFRYLLPYTFTIIALVCNNYLRIRQPGNQARCHRTIIDFSAGNFKLNWQAITINRQMNLRGISRTTFSDGLRLLASCSRTMLMCFNIAAINKFPLTIRINRQRFENT